jgi:hypothetical protein
LRKRRSCQSAKFFLLKRLTHRESETRFFYEKTWFVLEDSVKNPVSLVCVRPGLTDRVISAEELLIKLNVFHGELVTAALGGTPSLEGSLRQRTIAPTLSDGGFPSGELKNPVSERQGASRRGRNLSESGFLSFCVQRCLFLRNIPPACSPKA